MRFWKNVLTGLMIIYILLRVMSYVGIRFDFSVSAYEFPSSDESYWVDVQDSNLGRFKIYFPVSADGCMALSGNSIINECSGNITGYSNVGSTQYAITFTPFTIGTYRFTSGTTTTTRSLNISRIYDYNMPWLDKYDFLAYLNYNVFNIAALCLVSGLLFIIFIKRR